MKIKYLLIAVLAGAALVGCNKETGVDSGEPNANGGDTYVTFNIITPAATAEDTKGGVGTPEFVNGSAEEAAYETIRFIFYRNGSKVAVSSTDNLAITDYQVGTVTTSGDPESDFEWDEQTTGGSVERIAQAKVILRSNGSKPNQVLVFMNMEKDDFVEIAKKQTLNEALEMANDPTIGAKTVKPHNMFVTPSVDPSKAGQLLFVMSNSSHFNGSNKVYATEIPAAAIKETATAAVAADAITVYLDRVASKVQVNLDAIAAGKELPTTGDEAIVTSKNKPIKITPLNWSLNAVQRKTFWTKNIEYNPASWDDGSTRSLYRTWWAVDPNYNVTVGAYDSTFPNTAYQHDNQPGSWDLFYYNVADLLSHSDKKINNWDGSTLASALALTSIDVVDKSTANFNKTQTYFEKQYCLENTLGSEVANYRRTGTHVIILAQATVDGNQVDLYRYNNTFYEEADWKEAMFGEAVGIQASKTFWSGPADPTVAGTHPFTQLNKLTNLDDIFSIEKAMEDAQHRVVKCDKDNSDGLVSIFLTSDGKALNWYVQKAAFPAGFNPATDVNDTNWATYFDKITQPFDDPADPSGKTPNMANELAKAIVSVIEPTNAYTMGLLYFCVPIEHLNPISTGATPEIGNYGVVRNHWYDITVSDIKGTGTGIYDPSEPIVPGDKTPNWYLAAKININAWHKVAQNGVELVD